MIFFTVIYQFLLYVSAGYALAICAAGFSALSRRVWVGGLAMAIAFAATATIFVRQSFPRGMAPPTRDLIASYLSLYALPTLLTLAVAVAVEHWRASQPVKFVVLLCGTAAALIAAQYVAGGFFDIVNASG